MTLENYISDNDIHPLIGGTWSPMENFWISNNSRSVVIHIDDIKNLADKWKLWSLDDYVVTSCHAGTVHLAKI